MNQNIETKTVIRKATRDDAPAILELIKALAEYEELAHEVKATEKTLTETLFDAEQKVAFVLIAEQNDKPVGYALSFYSYSTFLAKPGIYLEDLFVYPEYRGQGIGKSMLLELVKIANDEGYGRVEWSVLDWNTPSIEFYKKLGAKAQDEWTMYRLDRQTIEKLTSKQP